MAFTLPTLAQLRRLVRDDIAAHLPGADASVPNSNMRALADAKAGLTYEVILYISNLAAELLPDTAQEWLDRHADIWLQQGRKEATFAGGVVYLTGAKGVTVPALTSISSNAGVTYRTTAPVTLGLMPTPVPVEALDAGTVGNADAGLMFRLTEAVPGVDGNVTTGEINGGVDTEGQEELRERILARIQNPPHGGAAHDYVAWAKEVPGITRAWAVGNEMGIGTVSLRVMADQLRASSNGIPTAEDLATVAAHLETVRPVAVRDLFTLAPIPEPVNLTVANLDRDDVAVRAAIEKELRDMLDRRAAPGQTIYRSWVSEAISAAVGEDHHDLTFGNLVMPTPGHLGVIGTIAYA